MPHIHEQPGQHDLTASAYIVRTDGDRPRFLLHQHKKLGLLLQIGGHVELLENPWQAVLHEVTEESGYTPDQLKLLQPSLRIPQMTGVATHPHPVTLLTHPFPGLEHSHIDIAWAFVTEQSPKQPVSDGESDTLQFLSAEELRTLPSNAIPENVSEAGLFVLEAVFNTWEQVP